MTRPATHDPGYGNRMREQTYNCPDCKRPLVWANADTLYCFHCDDYFSREAVKEETTNDIHER